MPLPCSIVVNGTRVIEICVVEVLHSEPRANRAKSGAANLATVLTLLHLFRRADISTFRLKGVFCTFLCREPEFV